jgi:putative ABC transport system permease protein
LLATQILYPQERRMTREERQLFVREAVERIRAIPGIVAVSPALAAPHLAAGTTRLEIPGVTLPDKTTVVTQIVGEDYFRTTGVPLISGRVVSRMDVEAGRPVTVVNQRFSRELLGGADPIGRAISFPAVSQDNGQKTTMLFEIVGVVGDTRLNGAQADPRAFVGVPSRDIRPQVYLPYTSVPVDARTILVRTSVDPRSVVDRLRREVAAVNPEVVFHMGRFARETVVLEDVINRATFASPKFGVGLMTAFAAVGLILAAIGVFSVMSYTVSLQTRDIGIRMALGARADGLVRAIVLKGLWPVGIGSVVGVGTAYGLSRLISSQLYGVTANDPWTFIGVVAVLSSVGALACLLPARRATRVDPLVALRSE